MIKLPQGYKQMESFELPLYHPMDKAQKLIEMKRRDINAIKYLFLLFAVMINVVIISLGDEGFSEPVFLSKAIVYLFSGSFLLLSLGGLKNRIPKNCEVYGKKGICVGFQPSARRKDRAGDDYMLVSFPDIEKGVRCLKSLRGQSISKGSEVLVFSFDKKEAYGVSLGACKLKKKKNHLFMILVFLFIFCSIGYAEWNTPKYDAKVLETRYEGTETRRGKRRDYTVHVGTARAYVEDLNEEVIVSLTKENKASFPEPNDVIKISNTTGEWFENEDSSILLIVLGTMGFALIGVKICKDRK